MPCQMISCVSKFTSARSGAKVKPKTTVFISCAELNLRFFDVLGQFSV